MAVTPCVYVCVSVVHSSHTPNPAMRDEGLLHTAKHPARQEHL